jgi:hypothetical protein
MSIRVVSLAVGLIVVLSLSLITSAATVYEPVQFQYQAQARKGVVTYYYGGSNPAVAEHVERSACLQWGPNTTPPGFIAVAPHTPRVYSDCAHYMNSSIYGYTPTDARNDAYNNVPRYFRMADLHRAGYVASDGTHVVPAQARPVTTDEVRTDSAATQPATQPILIIPKKMLEKPAHSADTHVANAR